MKNYPVISERTWEEWPANHPLRQLPVLPNEVLETGDVVVCSIKGDPRIPPAPDDADIEAKCVRCGIDVVHRRSAPALPKECWRCYQEPR